MWTTSGSGKKTGVALYNFDGCQVPHGLSLDVGDAVHVLEECGGWMRGYTTRNKHTKGIFPRSYVNLKEATVTADSKGCGHDDQLITELTRSIRSWARVWKAELFVKDNMVCQTVRQIMLELVARRKELMTSAISNSRRKEVRQHVAGKIDWVNKSLRMDVVPRMNFEQVDPDAVGPVALYGLHSVRKPAATMLPGRSQLHIYQLYMQLRSFQCQVGIGDTDRIEVYFSLYNARESKYICERILCKLDRDGKWVNDSELGKGSYFSCLMVDMTSDVSREDIHIVAHVCRIGSLLLKDGAKKAKQIAYKRPVGCGVLGISDVLQGSLDLKEECTHLIKIVQCSSESDFPTLVDNIIRKHAVKESKNSGAGANSAIVISLRLLTGDLASARKNHPLLFTRSLAYAPPLTINNLVTIPDATRNDLYITINKGEFDKGSKKAGLNVEVKATLIHRTNGIVQDCFISAAGDTPSAEYKSMVFYHNSQPHWGETFRLAIPTDAVVDVHVRFEFRHCSVDAGEKRLLAFSFLKVADADGAPIIDGRHELVVYTVSENQRLSDTTCTYVDLPYLTMHTATGNQVFTRSTKESFHVDTVLCSMLITQCGKLLNFFKWRHHLTNLPEILHQFKKADPNEMLKFYDNVFNILFEMFPVAGAQHEHHVFNALVHVLHIVADDRCSRLLPLCTTYIKTAFSAPLSFRYLLNGLRNLMDNRNWDQCYHVFKTSKGPVKSAEHRVVNLLFKFIVQAAVLHKRLSGDKGDQEVLMDVSSFWHSVSALLSSLSSSGNPKEADALRKTQAALLDEIPGVVDNLTQLVPPKELADQLITAVASACQDDVGRLVLPRLQCIRSTVTLSIFDNDDARNALVGICAAELKACLLRSRHVELAAETLGELLSSFHRHRSSSLCGEDVQTLVTSLLDAVIATILDQIGAGDSLQMASADDDGNSAGGRSARTLGSLVACLVGLLDAMDEAHYLALLRKLPSRDVQKGFTVRILHVLIELTTKGLICTEWTIMLMVTNRAVMKVTRYIRQSLTENFLGADNFEPVLWEDFMRLTICFITQPCLQLETFHDDKAEGLVEKYGDMRLRMCEVLLSVWSELGERRISFIPAFVRPFLEVSLIPEQHLRQMMLPIFFDVMLCEQKTCGNFGQVAAELVDGLDQLINTDKGDSDYVERFRSILLQKAENDGTLKQEGCRFISSVSDLLERLLGYRKVLRVSEAREAHMFGTLSVLDFYDKEICRGELYNAYVYRLADLHLEAGEYTEAACTLMLCGSKLSWATNDLLADAKFPAQKEWERKRTLYERCIRYFEQGESYERGIPLCKELAQFYEHRLYDYSKLSAVLTIEAKFFNSIITKEPDSQSYFRVGFIGRAFPLFLRNRVFIYRGGAYSQFASVDRKLRAEFPNAKMLNPTTVPSDDMRLGAVEYIQLSPVQPLHCEQPAFPDAVAAIDRRLMEYQQRSTVDRFQYDAAYHKGNRKDDKNEFRSLCVSRQTFTIAHPLPWVLRWSEVTSIAVEELSPIQVAVDAVQKKNKEVLRTVQDFATGDKFTNVQPLSRQLGGVIDAAVNGGIAKYQEAFFAADYIRENPTHGEFVSKLKALFIDQVRVLSKGMALHGSLVTEDMKPYHDNLEETFKRMRRSMKATAGIDVADENLGEADSVQPVVVADPAAAACAPPPVPGAAAAAGSGSAAATRRGRNHSWLKELDYDTLLVNGLQSTMLDASIGDVPSSRGSSGYSSSDSEIGKQEQPKKDYDMLPQKNSGRQGGYAAPAPSLPRKNSEPSRSSRRRDCGTSPAPCIGTIIDGDCAVFDDEAQSSAGSPPPQISLPPKKEKRGVSAVLPDSSSRLHQSPAVHEAQPHKALSLPRSFCSPGDRGEASSPLQPPPPALPPKGRKPSLPGLPEQRAIEAELAAVQSMLGAAAAGTQCVPEEGCTSDTLDSASVASCHQVAGCQEATASRQPSKRPAVAAPTSATTAAGIVVGSAAAPRAALQLHAGSSGSSEVTEPAWPPPATKSEQRLAPPLPAKPEPHGPPPATKPEPHPQATTPPPALAEHTAAPTPATRPHLADRSGVVPPPLAGRATPQPLGGRGPPPVPVKPKPVHGGSEPAAVNRQPSAPS